MLIVVFVVINNEEEAAVVLSEGYTSESPGSTFAKIYMLSLARCTESESRFWIPPQVILLLILVKNHLAGGGHDRTQEDQWVAAAIVRAGGDWAGQIQSRVERSPGWWPWVGSKEGGGGVGGDSQGADLDGGLSRWQMSQNQEYRKWGEEWARDCYNSSWDCWMEASGENTKQVCGSPGLDQWCFSGSHWWEGDRSSNRQGHRVNVEGRRGPSSYSFTSGKASVYLLLTPSLETEMLISHVTVPLLRTAGKQNQSSHLRMSNHRGSLPFLTGLKVFLICWSRSFIFHQHPQTAHSLVFFRPLISTSYALVRV